MLATCPCAAPPLPDACAPAAVEVFTTDVASAAQGAAVLGALRRRFPALRASLDLEDPDRVLRVQARRPVAGLWEAVAQVVRGLGVWVEVMGE